MLRAALAAVALLLAFSARCADLPIFDAHLDAAWSRQWLADLPPPVAERIAWKNGEALFGGLQQD